jgi:hypothetical protein
MNTEVPKRRRTDSSDTDSFHKVDMAYADNSDLQSDVILKSDIRNICYF